MVLGQEILNPTTGLSLKDYLDGKEAVHNELLMRVNNKDFPGEDSTTYLDTEAGGDVQGVNLGWYTEEQLAANMRAYDALYAERSPYADKVRGMGVERGQGELLSLLQVDWCGRGWGLTCCGEGEMEGCACCKILGMERTLGVCQEKAALGEGEEHGCRCIGSLAGRWA